MRRPKLGTLSKSFDALFAEKRSLLEKEEALIAKLNKVLAQLGYRVVRAIRSDRSPVIRRRRLESRRRPIPLHPETSHHGSNQKRRGRPSLRKVA